MCEIWNLIRVYFFEMQRKDGGWVAKQMQGKKSNCFSFGILIMQKPVKLLKNKQNKKGE